MNDLRRKRHFSSSQIIIFGFIVTILAGCLLLMLPFATRDGRGAHFLDALFTSTSAVCVTGLVVQDTASYWSVFGQLIIMILIQVGGMGVVTVAVIVAIISGKKIGLMQRSTMQEAISAPQVGGIVRLTGFILKTTMILEISGSLIMMTVLVKDFGIMKGIWYSVFHSISAFCNAGFDLMGRQVQFSSLTRYIQNPVINITIMLLIIGGGIGFTTWEDIKTNQFHFKRYRMQSKVILTTSLVLILLPALYFYFVEFSMERWKELSTSERVWGALFQSVTPRTAGFNTIDLSTLSEAGQAIMIILMLIGGSPGSTAGGIKTTTVAVLFFSSIAVFHRKEDAQCFGRRVAADTIKYASTILLMYIVLCLSGGILISCIEQLPIMVCLFEAASAIGTVGLTLGITTGLGSISRLILIILMFCGRVGGLTLVYAAISGTRANISKLPQEKIIVG